MKNAETFGEPLKNREESSQRSRGLELIRQTATHDSLLLEHLTLSDKPLPFIADTLPY